MKLIDLLVQELPKRGGWPDGALSITQDNDGSLCAWDTNDPHYEGFSWKHHTGNSIMHFWYGEEWATPLSSDHKESIVTYWQYKAALSASKKLAWNGEGLPPVGCECVVTPHNTAWGFSSVDDYTGRVLAYDGEDFWFVMLGGVKVTSRTDKVDFRPIKSEADKKRDVAVEAMNSMWNINSKMHCESIYDAIAAGKIPGVKLED